MVAYLTVVAALLRQYGIHTSAATPITLKRATLPTRARFFSETVASLWENHISWPGSCLGSCTVLKEKKIFYFEKAQEPKQEPSLK